MLILTTAELQIRLNGGTKGCACITHKTFVPLCLCVPLILFSLHDPLDIVEFIKRFQWREVIHIKIQDFIPYLTEHRIIQLEETKLHSVTSLIEGFC